MPIVKQATTGNTQVFKTKPFPTEAELERILSKEPELLSDDDEPPIALVQRQFGTLAGPADLLLIDAEGLPIVVEVKLAKNREIHRQVVGQVFDYVSELASLTVDELDERVNGKLQEAMRSLVEDEDEGALERCWKACGVNLRAGKARVIVATDEAPDRLVRIIRFLNDHSDLDVRLVEVRQYHDERSEETTFVPNLIVCSQEPRVVRTSGPSSTPNPKLQEIVVLYQQIAQPDFSLRGHARNYRKVIAPDWDTRVIHYEIIDWGPQGLGKPSRGGIGAEIHLEGKKWSDQMVETVRSFELALVEQFGREAVMWDPEWSAGRLAVIFDPQAPSRTVAEAMAWIIERTWEKIDEAYKLEGWIDS